VLLHARNASGNQAPCGGEAFAATLQYPNGTIVAQPLVDYGNGSYLWTAFTQLPGTYTFRATLAGTDLAGSPRTRAVDPAAPYGPAFDTALAGGREWVAGAAPAACFTLWCVPDAAAGAHG
jgi:hypothetical protein